MKKKIITIKYTSIHGEQMILVMDNQYNLWFKHEDCNDKFEVITKKSLQYILSSDEQVVFNSFLALVNATKKRHKEWNDSGLIK